MTLRCSTCGISYPIMGIAACQVCEGKLSPFSDAHPDRDWREKVALALSDPLDYDYKVPKWRYAELMRAGFSPREAEELAARTDVDLHIACEIALESSPEMAYSIVS